jgi:alpha-methylacyl-CoA racemase
MGLRSGAAVLPGRKVNGITQPAPAPRFRGTPAAACQPVGQPAANSCDLLAELGDDEKEITAIVEGVHRRIG